MGIFSISPAVTYSENDYSGYTPQNLPSAKTGFVVRAETGYANKIMPFTTESELLALLGKPTAANYLDWFNAWNFTQYASSGYVVRPLNDTVKNAGVELTGGINNSTAHGNLFNPDVAELELQEDITASRIAFFNRYVTPVQSVGLAVCSSSVYWDAPIANEFCGVVTRDGSTLAALNSIGGAGLASGEIAMTGNISLVAGSKFILNGNKLATVRNVYQNKVLVNGALVEGDISLYYGTVKTAQLGASFAGASIDVVFDATARFNIEPNAIFVFTKGVAPDTVTVAYYVSAIGALDTGTNTYTVTLTKITAVNGAGTPPVTIDITATEIVSNSEYYTFTPSADYLDETNWIIPAGTTTFKVEPGFNFPVGATIKFVKTGEVYTDLATDVYPEEPGTVADNYEIIAIDTLNNTITLDRGLEVATEIPDVTVLNDIVTIASGIRGINLYSTVYDDSVINKTTVSVTDLATSEVVVLAKESLVTFNQLFNYEPDWVADEFVTLTLKKNTLGKFELVDKTLASYQSTARDHLNNNLFANEVFFYGSSYLYCKVNEDDSLAKANTANGPLVKFVSDFGSGTSGAYVYGTVYPLAKNNDGTIKIDVATGKGTYDPNAYAVADIQNAANLYADSETFDINILIAHQLDMNIMSTIAETRKDCITVVAPYDYKSLVGKQSTVATQTLLEGFGTQTVSANKIFTAFGTYSAIYGNMKYQYDKFNDVNRWVCLAGDIAGLYAQTDATRDPWYAPAGLERGKVKNVIKLALNTMNKANKDAMYLNAINPIVAVAGEGAGIVFGQRTATAKPSALDRVNVRRLMITIEKAISTAVKYGLFEFNDSFTRARLVGVIDPYLRNVKARRGVYFYSVICDTTNNTPSVIDNNGLVIDTWVQPEKDAESIHINFNILGQSASINEIVGKSIA